MECPVCGDKLRAVEKHSVEIDVCPGCKGVWLDRGELEKILEMASAGGPPAGAVRADFRPDERVSEREASRYREEDRHREDDRHHDDRDRDDRNHDERNRPRGQQRRGSWLGDILGGIGGGGDD